jgi:amino acid adenylation domain-containing protein
MSRKRLDPAGPAGAVDRLPLAPLQETMLAAHRVTRIPDLHLEQWVMLLPEQLDLARFRRAWQWAWTRHPALRSGFGWDRDGSPFQWVADTGPGLPWRHVDLTGAADATETRWEELLAEDRACGFDLSRPPCTRLLVAHCGAGDWRACWSLHHILLDGRSMSTVLTDVFSVYDGMGVSPGVDDLFHRYLLGTSSHGPTQAARDFWCQSLAGVKPLGRFPFERPAAATEAAGTISLERAVPAELSSRLHATAASLEVTINTLVQAAWGWALGLFAGTADVVFAALRAGRPRDVPGARQAVGQFVATLPVRVSLHDENMTLAAWLAAQRSVHVAAGEHAWVTPGQIAAWLGQRPDEPFLGSLLAFERERPERGLERTCGGDKGRRFFLRERADFPLILSVWERGPLELCLAYDRVRYPAWAMAELLDTVHHLLQEMAGDPARRLRDIPLLPAGRSRERQEWNGRACDPPEQPFLHAGFEAIATRDPARLCLVEGQASCTYGELEIRANELADRFAERGVGPEVRVALWLRKTFRLPAAILGILKAGGAYLPLDFSAPAQALGRMLSVSGAALLLVDDEPPPGLQLPSSIQVMSLAAEEDVSRRRPARRPEVDLRANHLAYAIFTSGTSGIPKLVGVEHRSAANLIAHAVEELLDPADVARVPFIDNVAFDSSVSQMFVTWTHGGALVFHADLAGLGWGEAGCEPTAIGTVPSAMRVLLETVELPSSVRVIGLGGEAVPGPLLERIGRLGHLRKAFNYYGPTETTVYSMVAPLVGPSAPADGSWRHSGRNLGRPIRNTQIHLLDGSGRPVPLGVPGEIHVGGLGVARGYLDAPPSTAESFLPDPWGGGVESRLYRTGDLGFRLPDGTVEFLGRRDQQVKVRGLRVELEAIEAALSGYPAIRDVVVIPGEDTTGETRLVAYCVFDASLPSVAPEQLRSFLAERLPAFMVPSAFVQLEAFPLTPSGKLDRKALPAPSRSGVSEHRVEPATDLERRLHGIWAEVLGNRDFGVTDNFFAVGGHSLAAARLVSRIEQALGRAPSVTAVFRYPTIASLAPVIAGVTAEADEQEPVTGIPLAPPVQIGLQ